VNAQIEFLLMDAVRKAGRDQRSKRSSTSRSRSVQLPDGMRHVPRTYVEEE
jgi:hypothetical protein